MIEGVIYIRVCTVNNKKYIGQTIKESKRISAWNRNSIYSGKNSIIDKARIKYGKLNFTYKVLKKFIHEDINLVTELLNKAEELYIDVYNTFFENGQGYNMTKGGNHRHISLSDNHKKEISNSLKGKIPKNLSFIQQSEKTKNANRARGKSVIVTSVKNNFEKTYSSANQACLDLNLNRGDVSKVIRNISKHTKGYIIKLKD